MQEENLCKQEESVQKQEAMRRGTHLIVERFHLQQFLLLYSHAHAHTMHTHNLRHSGTIEYEAELCHKNEMARVAAEIKGK